MIKGTYSQVSEINFFKIMSKVDLDVTNKNIEHRPENTEILLN